MLRSFDPRETLLRAFHALAATLLAASAAASERTIDKQVVVDAPVARVWDASTTRVGIVGFFAPDAEVDARVDGAFHIFFDPSGAPGAKGADTARFLALQPESMLSFDWIAPPSMPAVGAQRTVVVVRLEALPALALPDPLADRTCVRLHHVGWGAPDGADGAAWDAAFRDLDRAWDGVRGNLQKRFRPGGEPVDWTAFLEKVRATSPSRNP